MVHNSIGDPDLDLGGNSNERIEVDILDYSTFSYNGPQPGSSIQSDVKKVLTDIYEILGNEQANISELQCAQEWLVQKLLKE